MFDVRPTRESGDLDWEKIEKAERVVRVRYRRFAQSPIKEKKIIIPPADYSSTPTRVKKSWVPAESASGGKIFPAKKIPAKKIKLYQLGKPFFSDEIPVFYQTSVCKPPAREVNQLKIIQEKLRDESCLEKPSFKEKISFIDRRAKTAEPPPAVMSSVSTVKSISAAGRKIAAGRHPVEIKPVPAAEFIPAVRKKIQAKKPPIRAGNFIQEAGNSENQFSFSDFFLPCRFALSFGTEKMKKSAYSFAGAALIISLFIFAVPFYNKSLNLKNKVLGVSTEGVNNLEAAAENVKNQDFINSSANFREAYENFSNASGEIKGLNGLLADAARYIPVISQISSGKNAVEAGKHLALAGEYLSRVAEKLKKVGNPISGDSQSVSLLEIFQSIRTDLETTNGELVSAREFLDKINIDDLPEEKRTGFLEIKNKLPAILSLNESFLKNGGIFIDLLGGNGPRKYLFLFQNSQEMRATGGFIGSYGLLDVKDGRVRKFFVDNIFNPDGQLKENIVPPNPIMKISAAWSLHDSNWWPDFPKSAEKAMLFYEKTGGPTVDGVIALTPAVMQNFLEITGPIEMPDYGVTLDADNFVAKTQSEVEADYDKEENQPKKILADLAPIVLDKVFNSRDFGTVSRSLEAVISGLNQKHILLYSENEDLQKIISDQGWSGEILDTPGDYLSVVNSNINGYKTDGVIEEIIKHEAEIKKDGSVVDTVTIARRHNGGDTDYEWWNKVNADYMRVYVPLGSQLISAEGQTREFVNPPLDYGALGFKRDADVEKEENSMDINQETGTRIYEDSGKTVFANWVYVSPKETAEIKYQYLVPFKVFPENGEDKGASYSILFQKQSGSAGSELTSVIKKTDDYEIVWNYPENISNDNNEIKMETDLKTDKFIGAVFARK